MNDPDHVRTPCCDLPESLQRMDRGAWLALGDSLFMFGDASMVLNVAHAAWQAGGLDDDLYQLVREIHDCQCKRHNASKPALDIDYARDEFNRSWMPRGSGFAKV